MRSLIIIPFLFTSLAIAEETRELGRSPIGLLMGGAYTALADDEYTLFYNPAILARHKGFSFNPFNPTFGATNFLKDQDRFSDIGSDPSDFSDAAFNYPAHFDVNITPGFKMEGVGLSAIMDFQLNFHLQNSITPMLEIDHRYDKGFVLGYGRAFKGSYTSDGGGEHLAWGVSTKFFKRESIYGNYNLTGTSLLGALNNTELSDVLNDLGKIEGQGWGFDAGIDYAKSTGNSSIFLGLALLDIYTILHTKDNDQDLDVQTQPMRVNFGSAWVGKLVKGLEFKLSMDIKHLEKQMEFMRRVHLGSEIKLTPALSLYGGVNAIDNYSYGIKLNIGFLKIYTGFYTVEIGEKLSQLESDRFVLYLSMFDFTFDP